jgi:glycosyltransferase involved in cell wall biosynthesis
MLRLLIYSHFFAPSIGGVETVVADLARGLAGLKDEAGLDRFQITVVTNTAGEVPDHAAPPFRVVRAPSAWRLWRLMRGADLVHVAGAALPPLLLGRISMKHVVVEHHGFQVMPPAQQLAHDPQCRPSPGSLVRRWLCNRADRNITPTKWLAQLLQLPRTITVPHGVPEAAAVVAPRVALSPPRFLFVGRLVITKGLRLLLEAARLLHQKGCTFELRIVGDGPERGALEALARESGLGDVVRFEGKLSHGSLSAAWQEADIVVAPSIGGEVFGMAPLEAMARGLPVIASDLGSFAEVVGNAGDLFKTGDAADLAGRMKALMDAPSLRTRLSEAGRERVAKHFGVERMVREHARIYEQLSHGS